MGSPPQPGPRGYLSLDRGTHWASKGLPIAGAESPPRLPCTGPQSSLQSGLVVARLLYLQRKVKQQRPPLIGRVLHPHLLGGWYFAGFLGPSPLLGLFHLSAPFAASFLGYWHTAGLLFPSTGALAP